MSCTLGLDCSQMGEDEYGACSNEEACHNYTNAQDLYEVVLLKGLPGAIYLCWHNPDSNYEWADIQWGFSHLHSYEWVLYYAASQNSFAEWQRAYYKLSSRNNTKYVRTSLQKEFDLLCRRVDRTQDTRQNGVHKLFW